MARLPTPGGDKDAWASILNDYLQVIHNDDGTLKTDSVHTAALQSRTIGIRHLRTINKPDTQIQDMVLSTNGDEFEWRPIKDATKTPGQRLQVNVADYGAKGDGTTDDTNAIQQAIDAAQGGSVDFPRGVYAIRSLKIRNKGTTLIGAARWGTRLVRHSGTEPLIDMSGTGTGQEHLRYCSVINLMLSGDGKIGPLLRLYYADNCIFRDINFIHCPGIATDIVEVWDSRFESCTWEHCGSNQEPATLLRNSLPHGYFGHSPDNTNQIHFIACRWEGFKNGAVRLHGRANRSDKMLNSIFFVACKMETSVAAGPVFQILRGCNVIFVNQLYIAIMGRAANHAQSVDAIEDRGSHVFMTNVYVQWGPTTGLAKSVARIMRGCPHMYHDVSTFYPTEDPEQATIVVEPEASQTMVSGLWVNRGKPVLGDAGEMLGSGAHMGLALPLQHPASFRITDHDSKQDLIKVDNNPERPALHLLNSVDGAGFSDNYKTETWRVVSKTGAARFAGDKFQIEGTKGYVGINKAPYASIALLIQAADKDDRGMVIARPAAESESHLLEFQDESYQPQGVAFDPGGRLIAVGTPPRVAPGEQVTYATPANQVRDQAGAITAAVKPSPTAPGTIATITFSRPFAAVPLAIAIHDHSAAPGNLYISARSTTSFTVSTRSALRGGLLLRFDYTITA